jgi:hypothetical protein
MHVQLRGIARAWIVVTQSTQHVSTLIENRQPAVGGNYFSFRVILELRIRCRVDCLKYLFLVSYEPAVRGIGIGFCCRGFGRMFPVIVKNGDGFLIFESVQADETIIG